MPRGIYNRATAKPRGWRTATTTKRRLGGATATTPVTKTTTRKYKRKAATPETSLERVIQLAVRITRDIDELHTLLKD